MGVWEAPPLRPETQAPPRPAAPAPAAEPLSDHARESRLVRLARELAMEMHSTDQILARYSVTGDEWDRLTRNHWFQSILSAEMTQWHAANTTHERVKLKSAVLVEQYLEEAYHRLLDPDETLNSKVELFKTLARIAGMGLGAGETSGGGFRVVINIAGQPITTRTINAVAEEVDDIEDVAVMREREVRREAEAPHNTVQLPGTRVTIREREIVPDNGTGGAVNRNDQLTNKTLPPRVTPPRELQASALRQPARRR